MSKFLVQRSGGHLIPMFNGDADKLRESKLKEGETYEVEIKKPRNVMFHRKYWALINICFDNQEVYEEIQDLRDFLTIKSGFYRKITHKNGYVEYKPKSISFASMDETEFEVLYKKTIDVICEFLEVEEQQILDIVIDFM